MIFNRGTCIQVTKKYNNVQSKVRPHVGDIGYISNIFLFPLQKFILCDGYFVYKDRLEHKLFVLNLGMKNKDIKKYSQNGFTKKFFLNNYCINLTPILFDPKYIKNSGNVNHFFFNMALTEPIKNWNSAVFPTLVSPYGLWKNYEDANIKVSIIDAKYIIGKNGIIYKKAWCMSTTYPIKSAHSNKYTMSYVLNNKWHTAVYNKLLLLIDNVVMNLNLESHYNEDNYKNSPFYFIPRIKISSVKTLNEQDIYNIYIMRNLQTINIYSNAFIGNLYKYTTNKLLDMLFIMDKNIPELILMYEQQNYKEALNRIKNVCHKKIIIDYFVSIFFRHLFNKYLFDNISIKNIKDLNILLTDENLSMIRDHSLGN